jgi:hypothetical protein
MLDDGEFHFSGGVTFQRSGDNVLIRQYDQSQEKPLAELVACIDMDSFTTIISLMVGRSFQDTKKFFEGKL